MPDIDLPVPPGAATASLSEKEQAAEWFALLRSGDATDADRLRWQAWLAASDAHRQAWSCVERVSQRFAPIQASADPRSAVGVLQAARARLVGRRRALLGLAAVGGTGLLGWQAWRHAPPGFALAWMADHRTGVGDMRALGLADGSRVWLGPSSAFSQEPRPDLRRLQLVAGEIFIETAADPARPFVVDTAHGRLRALGTRFNVRTEGGQTTVSVYEGAVELRTAASDRRSVVHAGEQRRFDPQTIAAAAPADPAHEGWTRGVLIALDMPLGSLVAELARYRHGHLGVAPEVVGLGVYGSFPLDDTDRALAMLVASLPVRLRQPLPWWCTVEARPRAAGEAAGR